MKSTLAPILGRLLIIPVIFGGMCLSMVLDVPMAQAMESSDEIVQSVLSVGHEDATIHGQDHAERSSRCASTCLSRDMKTAVNNEQMETKMILADVPCTTPQSSTVISIPIHAPPNCPDFLLKTLVGTTVKRE